MESVASQAEQQVFPGGGEESVSTYSRPSDHLMDRLDRLNLLLRNELARRLPKSHTDVFSFAAIDDTEVDHLLASLISAEEPVCRDISENLRRLDHRIEQRVRASYAARRLLPLSNLQRIFSLSSLEIDVLVACLASELDRRYERIYGYMHDDMSRKLPSVGLLLSVLCADATARMAARGKVFDPHAPLVRYQLLLPSDDVAGSAPWAARSLRVDERIVSFLLGNDEPDHRIREWVVAHPHSESSACLSREQTDVRDRMLAAIHGCMARDGLRRKPVIYLHGQGARGDDLVVRETAASLNVPLIAVDAEHLAALPGGLLEGAFLVLRECLLAQSALYLRGLDHVFDRDPGGSQQAALIRLFADMGSVMFLSGERPWSWGVPPEPLLLLQLQIDSPGYAAQLDLWRALAEGNEGIEEAGLHELVSRHPLSAADINAVWRMACSLAALRGTGKAPVMEELRQACRARSHLSLNGIARRIEPTHGWDDIVLPPDQMEQLRALCNQARNRSLVYGDWGFEQRLSLGKGLNALFAGPPGTGKTMAAEVVAHDLGMELYKIDLSQIVSKYIGETEKNLRQIFDQASRANAILFFDEADALLGKRSAVKDAHDRYANTEVAYLLQKMEEYEGVAILATNLRQNLDDAFTRRLRFIIELTFPDEAARAGIWQCVWPRETPLAPDIDPVALGRRFKLAGGNIRNIALSAAFAAAERGRPVDMELVVDSAKRELRKMGRLVDEGVYRNAASD